MKTDLFIDNNIAKNISNPMDAEYKKLIRWLMKNDPTNPATNAYLVVSKKLLAEYSRSTSSSKSDTSIFIIIDRLTREGRLIKINNADIKGFQHRYFSKKVRRELRSNREDHDHIPVVLLSDRKYALSLDEDFIYDLVHFPGFHPRVERRPEKLPYEE
ncbi:MAG: hypothetical protein NT166_13360 [Candidatus Aminicenantes bacterium]|nr:hypothetical protein [Candidatus Aminicenantes bacterium]